MAINLIFPFRQPLRSVRIRPIQHARAQRETETALNDELIDYYHGEAIIGEYITTLKSGKEATVHLCEGHPSTGLPFVAIKVYKDIERRSFRAMGTYLDGRLEHTILKRRDLLHTLSDPSSMQGYWVEVEYGTLGLLHGLGLPVPRPLARTGSSLAMAFIGDGTDPAPRLKDVSLDRDRAAIAHDELMMAVERMLAVDTIHGDLSAYNTLFHDGRVVIIDFPQAVDARYHSQGEAMLTRDIVNARSYFRRWGLGDQEESEALARDLWRRYEARELY
ncbi:MAG: hypothetical protein JXM71_02515 [Spirochaetales bacterium]|nr:hypothetical protein [Spirochaetales bacterium]